MHDFFAVVALSATLKFKLSSYTNGMQDKIRPLWRHYYQNTQGLIFVVDSNDRDRIDAGNPSILLSINPSLLIALQPFTTNQIKRLRNCSMF